MRAGILLFWYAKENLPRGSDPTSCIRTRVQTVLQATCYRIMPRLAICLPVPIAFQHTGHFVDHLSQGQQIDDSNDLCKSQRFISDVSEAATLSCHPPRTPHPGTVRRYGPCARERSRLRKTTRLFWFLNSTLRALLLMCHGVRRVLQRLA